MNNNNYRDTFKATTIFAGVQIIIIFVAIAKSKLIALWLGPYGLGLLSLYNSVLSMIYSISNLGLASSGVKEIASVLNDKNKLSSVVLSLKGWALWTGLIGMIVTAFLSIVLSRLTFDSYISPFSYIMLSCVILLNCLSYSNLAIIQGARRIRLLAFTNVNSALIGLIVSVPLYYFFRIKGIIPSIILTAFFLFLMTHFNLKKLGIVENVRKLSYEERFRIGLNAVRLGIMISISFIAVTVVEFILKTYISKVSSVNFVGLFQAGWTLNTTYLGMVFTAMATDFFPKLSKEASDDIQMKLKVNQQAEIAILILGPMIVAMVISLPLIIQLLYSNQFIGIVNMTRFLLIGSLFKAGSWTISFIFLAKGNGKLYLFNELGVKLITLPIYLLMYYYFKLDGIGIAFIADQIIYFLWVSFAAWIKYRFVYGREFFEILFISIILTLITYFSIRYFRFNLSVISSTLLGVFVLAFSLYKLNSKLYILNYLKDKIGK